MIIIRFIAIVSAILSTIIIFVYFVYSYKKFNEGHIIVLIFLELLCITYTYCVYILINKKESKTEIINSEIKLLKLKIYQKELSLVLKNLKGKNE